MEYQDTSREAFASVDHPTVDNKILAILRAGATDDEVETLTGMKHQTVSANRRHLVERGLVIPTGIKRPTRSGRNAMVWIAGA